MTRPLAQQKLGCILDLLLPYEEHRTYPAAIRSVERVFRGEGAAAARGTAQRIAEAYEEVFIRNAANGVMFH